MAEKRCNQCIHPVHPKNALHPQMLAVLFGPNRPEKKKDFQTPEFPPSISIPLFYFLFIVISTPKKKTSTVSPNHHLGLPSPANGTGIPCPLKSLGTGKASALMAGLSMDNDTIGPGDSGVHFHRKVGVSSQ